MRRNSAKLKLFFPLNGCVISCLLTCWQSEFMRLWLCYVLILFSFRSQLFIILMEKKKKKGKKQNILLHDLYVLIYNELLV